MKKVLASNESISIGELAMKLAEQKEQEIEMRDEFKSVAFQSYMHGYQSGRVDFINDVLIMIDRKKEAEE